MVSCNLEKQCGFGCQLHHAAYCLVMALATNRTMVLSSSGGKGWRYDREDGFEGLFRPLSDTW